MTNFLKMAQAIADLGYDVYIFKRFADGYRDDFVYQLSKIKTIFIVNPLTGRVYTCSHNCFLFEESEFLFGAVEYEPTMKRAEYGWEGYGYCCQENGTLDTAGLKDFFEEIFSDMEAVYNESKTGSALYTAKSFTERDIARLGYQIGFRYKYRIYPTAVSRKGYGLSGTGRGYKISAQEYYAEMKKQNPNLKIVVVDPIEDWEELKKMPLFDAMVGFIDPFSVEKSKQW